MARRSQRSSYQCCSRDISLTNPVDFPTWYVDQLDRNGNAIKSYELHYCFPTSVASVELSAENEEFLTLSDACLHVSSYERCQWCTTWCCTRTRIIGVLYAGRTVWLLLVEKKKKGESLSSTNLTVPQSKKSKSFVTQEVDDAVTIDAGGVLEHTLILTGH